MNRAYSVLEIKAVDDGRRVFTGKATTPSTDRMGDIVDPLGAKFKNPLPLLHQHDHQRPIGTVRFGKATASGIEFEADIPVISDAGPLKDRVDTAWGEIKAGLVRGVSIGFRVLKDGYEPLKDGGLLFKSIEIIELSAVTVPANADAQITVIRSIDQQFRAASGHAERVSDRVDVPPGVTGKSKPVKLETKMSKTVAEQISALEASRETKSARMVEIMEKAAEEGTTLDSAESEEYDTLDGEVESINKDLGRLVKLQKHMVAKAAPVEGVKDVKSGSDVRGGTRVEVRGHNLPKATAFTRYVMALANAKGNTMQAVEIAKQWHDTTPEVETVLRAAVAAGTTTDAAWAGPLVEYQQMASEFIELLRPATVIGRIPGLRRVPFNISMPRGTTGSSVGWVGEGNAKPVSALAFDTVTLRWAKAAGIVVLTDELVRFSNPSAEAVVRQDLVGAMAGFLDEQFLDPAVAAVNNVSPASITNGVTPIPASGTTADDLRADVKSLFSTYISANLSLASAVWIMSERMALAIAMLQNPLGQPEFPGLMANGGTFMGLPVVTSESVATNVADPASPSTYDAGDLIILAKASEIMLADDGGVAIDVSREASLQMDSEPTNPTTASTVLVSLWQRNMVGVRAERWINWAKRRSGVVQYIVGANYGDAAA